MKLFVVHLKQDDPKKCTASKLKRFRLVKFLHKVRDTPFGTVILNPFSEKAFSPLDRKRIERRGLVAIDCSWVNVDEVFKFRIRGISRCLPFLIAVNPTNYGKPTKLSTVEALSAALYITGFRKEAERLLSIFKWGVHFINLNLELLESYSQARNSFEIVELQKDFSEKL
ncbi:DUF367 family protein [Candidatus Bathyarchaeota archaeon]|nr:DUF367 family protein [Candidatus Bathyarchaeota archaeon]